APASPSRRASARSHFTKQYVRLIFVAVADPRDRRYAELLVDTCVGVQPGWQVLVVGSPAARPLLEEVVRLVAERDAYALLRVTFGGNFIGSRVWVRTAALERLASPAPIEQHALEACDAL